MYKKFFKKLKKNKFSVNQELVIFDVGAGDCEQTVALYHQFPNATIYAFECNFSQLSKAKQNIESYLDRIKLVEQPVYIDDQEISFYDIDPKNTITTWEDGNPGASSLFQANPAYRVETYVQNKRSLDAIRLDRFMQLHSISKVDILFLDNQGAEWHALKSLGKYLYQVSYVFTKVFHTALYKNQSMFSDIDDYLVNYYAFDCLDKVNTDNYFEYLSYKNRFLDDIIFDVVALPRKKQFWLRGKPKRYLLHTITLFKQYTNAKTILEIGSIRQKMNHTIDQFDPRCCNDGHSTYFWDHYTDADIYTVDIDPACKAMIDSEPRLKNVKAYTDDAIEFGKSFDKQIDLLFLDAWDVLPSIPYAEKHLEIYFILKDKLADNCLILIDDTDVGSGGKGKLIIPQLLEDGFSLLVSKRQTLLIRSSHEYIPTHLHHDFDIVIPVGPKDISMIEKQIEYTKKNVIGYRKIFLVSYDPSLTVDGCITISEDDFPFSIETVASILGKSDRNGWYLQQLLKLYAGFVIPNILDRYLVIDSDTYFVNPTTFVEDNRSCYATGFEYNKAYFDHLKRLHPSLKRVYKSKSGICHHMMFEKQYLIKLFDLVKEIHPNSEFFETFLKVISSDQAHNCGASEYELYFNFMLIYFPEKITLRQLKWKNSIHFQNDEDHHFVSAHWHMREPVSTNN
tara:strand:- start:3676 stop:5712 length:2037 start_codon:yes stop_codon:yes gene_type:complete